MPTKYHALHNVRQLEGGTDLTLQRSREVLVAVEANSDYTVVSLSASLGEAPILEILEVDVETHAVPPGNSHGIKFRERLSICVPKDPKVLVEVLAMRVGFPVLIHQNHGDYTGPASLCLYFEPPAVVLRTWTPQSFLRRIQWWLEKSAKNELHPADQPVERLFFATKFDLVLPWNFDELSKIHGRSFQISKTPDRPDGGATFFLNPPGATRSAHLEVKAAVFEFTLPPVVHGFVERDPSDLGSLVDFLLIRNADLMTPLKEKLQERVGTQGATLTTDETFTIVFLHIPMVRVQGGEVETTSHRAFLLLGGAFALGIKMGALFNLDGQVFNSAGVINPEPTTEWRKSVINPMEVQSRNSKAAARKQSGLANSGPSGVLVGAGSLGSALLSIWGRGGWGSWTVVDKDRIKPHNLSRHAAFANHVGFAKVEAVRDIQEAAMGDSNPLKIIDADACDPSNERVWGAIKAAELVIDASTTLEFPRLASEVDDGARQVSIFISPDGKAAVLMMEDLARARRLRTLEAQYYRAIIQKEWGKDHIPDALGTFWSGASCRDISFVLPYSTILTHAGLLSEQIQIASQSPEARISIWHRDTATGTVGTYPIDVFDETRHSFEGHHLYLDTGLTQKLKDLRTSSLPNETGGVLIGYFDLTLKSIWLVDCLAAPPDSEGTVSGFLRGTEGLATAVGEASRRTAGIVGYVGEWHSHPPGHSANPSQDDLLQLAELAFGMAQDGLPAVQLIVGESDIQILTGRVQT